MKNIAEEEATRPGAGYLPAGFRLSAPITPGRPGRDAHPEVAQGVRPVAAAPRSRRSRALPARRDGPRGVGEGLRPARDIRDPPRPPLRPAPRRSRAPPSPVLTLQTAGCGQAEGEESQRGAAVLPPASRQRPHEQARGDTGRAWASWRRGPGCALSLPPLSPASSLLLWLLQVP